MWDRLSDRQKEQYVRTVIRKLMEIARKDPVGAYVETITWLVSPEGALAWQWMWKPEYAEIMRWIGYWAIRLSMLSPATST